MQLCNHVDVEIFLCLEILQIGDDGDFVVVNMNYQLFPYSLFQELFERFYKMENWLQTPGGFIDFNFQI